MLALPACSTMQHAAHPLAIPRLLADDAPRGSPRGRRLAAVVPFVAVALSAPAGTAAARRQQRTWAWALHRCSGAGSGRVARGARRPRGGPGKLTSEQLPAAASGPSERFVFSSTGGATEEEEDKEENLEDEDGVEDEEESYASHGWLFDEADGALPSAPSSAGSPSELERPALYIVATPIGNLGDITLRAMNVLRSADVLYAEDTRVLRQLLKLLGIPTDGRPIVACHDFNEAQAASSIVANLRIGLCVALVSDAGTPLISDPGFLVLRQVREAFQEGRVPIRAVPGPCAAIAALSVAGAPAGRHLFAGFPSRSRTGKVAQLRGLLRQARGDAASSPATLILYEAPHRIVSTVEALADLLLEEGSTETRLVSVCRELTKRFETILRGPAPSVLEQLRKDPMQRKGEFVVLVQGGEASAESPTSASAMPAQEVVRLLSAELPKAKATTLAAKICGGSKKALKAALLNEGRC